MTFSLNLFEKVLHRHQNNVSVFLGERRSQNSQTILRMQAEESGAPSGFTQMSL